MNVFFLCFVVTVLFCLYQLILGIMKKEIKWTLFALLILLLSTLSILDHTYWSKTTYSGLFVVSLLIIYAFSIFKKGKNII